MGYMLFSREWLLKVLLEEYFRLKVVNLLNCSSLPYFEIGLVPFGNPRKNPLLSFYLLDEGTESVEL